MGKRELGLYMDCARGFVSLEALLQISIEDRQSVISALAFLNPRLVINGRGLPRAPIIEKEKKEEGSARDPLSLYLKEIRKYPVLTPAEEKQIFLQLDEQRQLVKTLLAKDLRGQVLLRRFALRVLQSDDEIRDVTDVPLTGSRKEKEEKAEFVEEQLRLLLEVLKVKEWDKRVEAIEAILCTIPLDFSIFQNLAENLKRKGGGAVKREVEESTERFAYLRYKIFQANLRLVVRVVRGVMVSRPTRHLEMLDLIQEGNLALPHAIERFEYERGYKFSTYAWWWIKQMVGRSISDQERLIRVPIHAQEQNTKWQRQERNFSLRFGRLPTKEERAQELGVPLKEMPKLKAVTERLSESARVFSLDAPVGNESESPSLGDFVVAPTQSQEDAAEDMLLKKRVNKELVRLKPREEKIVRMRFGIAPYYDQTLEEVGEVLAITRERVRQIKTKALRFLRRRREKMFFEP